MSLWTFLNLRSSPVKWAWECYLTVFVRMKITWFLGFPGSSVVKNLSAMQETQETWVWSLDQEDPLVEGQSTLVFLPGKSHRQRSLVGYSPWVHKELDTTDVTEDLCRQLDFHAKQSLTTTFKPWSQRDSGSPYLPQRERTIPPYRWQQWRWDRKIIYILFFAIKRELIHQIWYHLALKLYAVF